MRWLEIFETPLDDFSIHGDTSREGSFRPDDIKAMNNNKWVTKVETLFSKSPLHYNVYVYNGDADGTVNVGGTNYNGKDLGQVHYYAGVHPAVHAVSLIGKMPPNFRNCINIVLTNNEGDERLPLTPWMLAHRVAHAIMYAAQPEFKHSDPALCSILGSVSVKISSLGNFFTYAARELMFSLDHVKFFDIHSSESSRMLAGAIICNFGSARNLKVLDMGEMFMELFTQYIVRGSVKFNRVSLNGKTITDFKKATADPFLAKMMTKQLFNLAKTCSNTIEFTQKYEYMKKKVNKNGSVTVLSFNDLADMFMAWKGAGLLSIENENENFHQELLKEEAELNELFGSLLNACIGKFFFL